ncbi:hypothetical protein PSN45_000737 [Yamadazyma tenuis]|uniref:Uncharacterized protein n=1 Tax=Candida tenuis (strain ATCC 10573 / BCRC 21748 / CBS 615 / JCM 9827 / NBRC 10315 / NRRL Y-1498 / VKM Y-70) TaxID=590646 RepID=G3BAC7_CANTC|nr:uncharacterized protein CANTEDRAFT_94909 [Yamadazyma tenuis ATCC 10573]EGV62029.1 hypothetical protein CANTEDRAFT_94909 [Yamadazyma tenuis ATCC 10573]WEJ93275.1 hypothetical protein PSN45_000737 [Yamadazyma tenuis]
MALGTLFHRKHKSKSELPPAVSAPVPPPHSILSKLVQPSPQLVAPRAPSESSVNECPKKSKSQRFLSKYLHISSSSRNIRVVDIHSENSASNLLQGVSPPLDEMSIAMHDKQFSFDHSHPTNKLADTSEGDSLLNHYHRSSAKASVSPVISPVKSSHSLTSNILQDLSSINIQLPHVGEEPLLNTKLNREEGSPVDVPFDIPIRYKKISANKVNLLSRAEKSHILQAQDSSSPQVKSLASVRVASPRLMRSDSNLNQISTTVSFDDDDDISHSTSRRNSVNRSTDESNDNDKSYTEFETIKDVNYQVIKNYMTSSNVKIVSPVRSVQSHHYGDENIGDSAKTIPINDDIEDMDSKIKELSKPLNIPKVDFSKVDSPDDAGINSRNYYTPPSPPSMTSKDEVYRSEMLSLIETHVLMVHKKQEEIDHLKELLLRERKLNAYFVSPQSRENSPSFPGTPKFGRFNSSPKAALSPSSVDDSKKIRKQFIPLNITVTSEPKPNNYYPLKRNRDHLLPPFDLSNNIHENNGQLAANQDNHEFNLKPFHKFKVASPSMSDGIHYMPTFAEDTLETLRPGSSRASVALEGLQLINSNVPRSSIASSRSSAYFTAMSSFCEDSGDQDELDNDSVLSHEQYEGYPSFGLTPNFISKLERREVSGSTTLSSAMSRHTNTTNDSITNNTSISTAITTPDSMEFNIDPK